MAAIRKRVTSWTGADTTDGNTRQIVFHVETNSASDGPSTVQAYCGFARGDAYSYGSELDETIRCTNVSSQPLDANRLEWIVTVDFARSDTESNPLNEPARFSRSQQNREVAYDKDSKGKPLVNSAGDLFEDVLTKEVSRTVLRVEKNYATWSQSMYDFVNTVNRNPWAVGDKTYRVRQARLSGMSDSQEYSNVLKSAQNPIGLYYAVSLEFTFADDDWDTEIIDRGFKQLFRRWGVTYATEDGKVKTEVFREDTRKQAEDSFFRKYPGAVDPIRIFRLPDGKEAVKDIRSEDERKQGSGKDSTVPQHLNGKGRQLVNGIAHWLEFVGYLEYDFDRFNLV